MQRLRPLVARVLARAATDASLSGDRRLPALGKLVRTKFGFLNRSIGKPVIRHLTRELTDLTRAAGIKSLQSDPKLAKSKLGSPQPRLAKPAVKRRPSRADKGKKPLGAKTQQKRARHAALTPPNAWHSARHACLRDRRDSGPRARFRATQTSVVDADARTASRAKAHELASNARRTSADEKNAPPYPATALRQRLCGNQNFTLCASSSTPSTRRLLDGVAMPVPRRSTKPGRPRRRREMT